jgi:acyl-CoA synthetase (AMP-forming)/AMP-acid ligase II
MKNDGIDLSRQLVLGEVLARWARKRPEKEMLAFKEKRYTYARVNARVNCLANALSGLGVKQGDKISVLFLNGNEIIECYFAAAKIGAVVVPLNFRLVGPELVYQIENSDSIAMVFGKAFAPVVDAIRKELPGVRYFISNTGNGVEGVMDYETLVENGSPEDPGIYVNDDDPAFIMYTSGTTGKPKGAVMSHKNILMDSFNLLMEFRLSDRDRYLCVPPLFHTAGLALAVTNVVVGSTIVLVDNFVPQEIPKILEQEKITITFLVPAMWIFLLQVPGIEGHNTESLRVCVTGAAVMPTDVKKRIMAVFPNAGVYDVFGQTEMSPCTTILKPGHALDKPGSVGLPILNVEVRIVDANNDDVPDGEIGEIVYKGPTLMKEYYKNPDATAMAMEDGWFHSGDLVKRDRDGFIHVVDRAKDMIITGGENVYSAEVEEVLFSHEKVLEVAVVGVPDPDWGERVKAVVVPVNGVTLTREEILEHCRENLAGYKKPRIIDMVDSLPRNAAGKVLKFKLRE